MNRSRLARAAALGSLAALGVVALPKDAKAAGYLTARYGADHGTPAMPNAFAIYFNPAALGGTKGTTLTGDLSVLLRFARYTRTVDALSPSDEAFKQDPAYVSANTGTANLTNLLALPFLGFNTDFGTKNIRAGYAAYIPFGGMATWTRRGNVPGVPGAQDGVQRWHNISGQILSIYNTFAFAYKIEQANLTIGASFSPIIHNVATARARNADGSDDTVQNGNLTEGRSFISATGINFGASAGLYWEPTPELHLGLSYNSQPGFGETRMSGTLRTQLGAGVESKADIDFLQTLPDLIRFGGTYRATDKLELRSDLEFTRWSVFKRQCVVEQGAKCAVDADGKKEAGDAGNRVQLNVPRNWKDTISLRAGPAYWVTPKVELFGSAAFSTTAVPKETIDPATIDSFALFGTFGARYEVSEHLALAGSYNHIYFLRVDTAGKNNQNLPDFKDGAYNASRSPSADGKYTSQIGFVNVNVAYTF